MILIDFRGSGNSQMYQDFQGGINNYWSISNLTYDAVAILTYYNIEKAIWIGYSTGGVMAIDAAINYPTYVYKLVLISAGPTLDPSTLVELNAILSTFTSLSRGLFVYSFMFSQINLPLYITEGLINPYYGRLCIGDFYKINFEAIDGIFVDGLAQAQFQNNKIIQDAFIVHGADDQLFIESTQTLLKAMFVNKNYVFYEYAGATHGVMFEQKVNILPNLINWLLS